MLDPKHIDSIYFEIVKDAIYNGTRKPNRTGVDTLSTFGHYYEFDLDLGFPLLTTKEISWKNIVIEMLWFLSGSTNIDFLKRHGCKFWDAWAERDTGNIPSAYGHFWRHFPTHKIESTQLASGSKFTEVNVSHNDQIKYVIEEAKRNPMSRRLVVSAWDPGNAQTSKLPPCHLLYMFNVQNEPIIVETGPRDEHGAAPAEMRGYEPRLCCHLTQRSADIALGVPYNIASYALLMHVVGRIVGIRPKLFGHTMVDAHIYTKKDDGTMEDYDHLPGLIEQIERDPRPLPNLIIDPSIQTLEDVERLLDPKYSTEDILKLFKLEGYDPHPAIKFKVAV